MFHENSTEGKCNTSMLCASFKMEAKGCDFNCDTVAIHIFIKGLQDVHNITGKVYEKNPQTLSEVIKLVGKLNTAEQVTATLSLPTVNMMLSDDRCFICSSKGHIGHHCPDLQYYNCISFGHFTQDCPEKISLSETPHYHDRSHSHHSCNHRDRSHSFYHTYRQGNHLTGQDHTINLNVTKASVTAGDMHPTVYHATTVVQDIHPKTDTPEGTPAGTPHTITDVTHS